eukprot:1700236-Pyramimonas_sp.AAC.1
MKHPEWSAWCAWAGGDRNARTAQASFVVERWIVGKQPPPKSRRAEVKAEADSDIDPQGECECWGRRGYNVTAGPGQA